VDDKIDNLSASGFVWSSVNLLPKPPKRFMSLLGNILWAGQWFCE
jgi:hypothetical protein